MVGFSSRLETSGVIGRRARNVSRGWVERGIYWARDTLFHWIKHLSRFVAANLSTVRIPQLGLLSFLSASPFFRPFRYNAVSLYAETLRSLECCCQIAQSRMRHGLIQSDELCRAREFTPGRNAGLIGRSLIGPLFPAYSLLSAGIADRVTCDEEKEREPDTLGWNETGQWLNIWREVKIRCRNLSCCYVRSVGFERIEGGVERNDRNAPFAPFYAVPGSNYRALCRRTKKGLRRSRRF